MSNFVIFCIWYFAFIATVRALSLCLMPYPRTLEIKQWMDVFALLASIGISVWAWSLS